MTCPQTSFGAMWFALIASVPVPAQSQATNFLALVHGEDILLAGVALTASQTEAEEIAIALNLLVEDFPAHNASWYPRTGTAGQWNVAIDGPATSMQAGEWVVGVEYGDREAVLGILAGSIGIPLLFSESEAAMLAEVVNVLGAAGLGDLRVYAKRFFPHERVRAYRRR